MASEIAALSLAAETRSAPKQSASNYVAVASSAELLGGGTVFLSRNRKAVARAQSGDAKPPLYLTAEVGTMQQSIPYRAVGTALAREVIPVGAVVDLYSDQDKLGALIDALLAHDVARDALLDAISNDDDALGALLGAESADNDGAPDGADVAPDGAELAL